MCNKKKFFYEGDCNARVANRYLSLLNAIEASKLAVDIPSSEALRSHGGGYGCWSSGHHHSAERRDQASLRQRACESCFVNGRDAGCFGWSPHGRRAVGDKINTESLS